METSNIIALVLGGLGFLLSIIGYLITPMLNLKSKKLEKRLENRFKMFEKVLDLWECTHNPNNLEQNIIVHLSEVN